MFTIEMKRLVAVIFVFSLLFLPETLFAANYVGIIISGYEKDCEVVHNGKAYQCVDKRQIYLGDIVRKKPSIALLKIKWAPYAGGAAKDAVTIEAASLGADKGKSGVSTDGLRQFISDFVKPTEYGTVSLVTRSHRLKALLPVRATLLPKDHPMKITGILGSNEGISSVVVTDREGQKIYEKQAGEKEVLYLVPSEMGIRTKETYTVQINGNASKRKFDVVLLDEAAQEEIRNGLAGIDSEKLPQTESLIRKAAYLQLVSDVYPDKYDLYWLGQQLIEVSTGQASKEDQEIIRRLRQRYSTHLKDTE